MPQSVHTHKAIESVHRYETAEAQIKCSNDSLFEFLRTGLAITGYEGEEDVRYDEERLQKKERSKNLRNRRWLERGIADPDDPVCFSFFMKLHVCKYTVL